MKKYLSIILTCVTIIGTISGCSSPVSSYKREVHNTELIYMIEDFIEEINSYEVPPLFTFFDIDLYISQDLNSLNTSIESIHSFAESVEGFNISAKEILVTLNELDVQDDRVVIEHQKIIETFEETILFFDQLSDLPDIYNNLYDPITSLASSLSFFESEFDNVSKEISDEFAVSFAEAQDDITVSFEILEKVFFATDNDNTDMNEYVPPSHKNKYIIDMIYINDSQKTLDELMILVDSMETKNVADETIATAFKNLFDSLNTVLTIISNNFKEYTTLNDIANNNFLTSLKFYVKEMIYWVKYIQN